MNETITALQKLSQAEKWLAEAKSLDDIQEIHDIAIAAEAYAKAHRLGLNAENHAMEVRMLAGRRIGELVPAEQGKRTDKKLHQDSVKSIIPQQRLSEFRKLAEIPMPEFKERLEIAKAHEEKITYRKILLDPSLHISDDSYEWNTPQDIIESAKSVMGIIDIDPASNETAQKEIQATKYYTRETNGLAHKWKGNLWMNPPYSMPLIEQFITKAIQDYNKGNLLSFIILTNNSSDTNWFHSLLKDCCVCFTYGRVPFWFDDGSKLAVRQGQAIFYKGPNEKGFVNEFSKYGKMVKGINNDN